MKKMSIAILLAFFTVAYSFGFGISLGVMGIGGMNSTTIDNGLLGSSFSEDSRKTKLCYGGGVYTNINFVRVFGIQIEGVFVANKGVYYKTSGGSFMSYKVNTIDVPLLLSFNLNFGKNSGIKFLLGPRVSFPMSDYTYEHGTSTVKTTVKLPIEREYLIGGVAGVDLSLGIGKSSALALGLRYGIDFMKTDPHLINLSEVYIKLGFEFRLGKAA